MAKGNNSKSGYFLARPRPGYAARKASAAAQSGQNPQNPSFAAFKDATKAPRQIETKIITKQAADAWSPQKASGLPRRKQG